MRIEGIEVERAIETARKALREEAGLSAALRTALEVLLTLTTLLLNRLTRGSHNSGTPPSQEPNRKKKLNKERDGRPLEGNPDTGEPP